MTGRNVRLLMIASAVILLVLSLTCAVSADEFSGRFLADSFSGTRAMTAVKDDQLVVAFYGSDAFIEGNIRADLTDNRTNAFRFYVAHSTKEVSLVVYYAYGEDDSFSDEMKALLKIEKTSEFQTYILPVPNAGRVKKIRMVSETTGLVTLRFSAITAVSAFSDDTVYAGELVSCTADRSDMTVTLKGTVLKEMVSSYPDARILVYSVDDNGEEKLCASAGLSKRFEIKIPSEGHDISSVRYKTVLTSNGEFFPLTAERYADLQSEDIYGPDRAFKATVGFDGDAHAGTVIVDCDLALLFSDNGSARAFRYGGSYFYLNIAEYDSLEKTVRTASLTSDRVLFRLISSNPGKEVPYTYCYNESGVFYYALNAESEEGRKYICAAVSMLSSLVSGQVDCGYILGRQTENAGEYNYCGIGLLLADYSEKVMAAARTVRNASITAGTGGVLYIGIGDRISTDAARDEFLYPNYDTVLYLETLARMAETYGGVSFGVVSETGACPDGRYGAENASAAVLKKMKAYVSGLASEHNVVKPRAGVIWTPDFSGDHTAADYAYMYYSELFSGGCDFFACDISDGSSADVIALMSSIDTENTLNAVNTVLSPYGVKVPGDFDDYSPEKLVKRSVKYIAVSTPKDGYRGSAVISRLSTAGGCYVSALVYGPDNSSYSSGALVIQPSSGADHAYISLSGVAVSGLSDGIILDLDVVSGSGDVSVDICGRGESVCRAHLSEGGNRLFFQAGDLPEGLRYMKLSFGFSGEIRVGDINAVSSSYSSREMAEMMSDKYDDDSGDLEMPLYLLAVAAAVSILSALLVRRKKKND